MGAGGVLPSTPSSPPYFPAQRGQCILFSVVFAHSPPSNHGSVSVLSVISVAGLSIHMIGEVSGDPKNKTILGPLLFNPREYFIYSKDDVTFFLLLGVSFMGGGGGVVLSAVFSNSIIQF